MLFSIKSPVMGNIIKAKGYVDRREIKENHHCRGGRGAKMEKHLPVNSLAESSRFVKEV